MPIPADTPGSKLFDHAAHRVYMRAQWGGPWELAPHVFCNRCAEMLSPHIGFADLDYRIGYLQQHDHLGFQIYESVDLIEQYVKIEIDQAEGDPIRWYGIVIEQVIADDGALLVNDTGVLRGQVALKCASLEILLRRLTVQKSWVLEEANSTNAELEINRAREFNPHTRLANFGNRSTFPGGRGAFLFTNRGEWLTDVIVKWRTENIVEYLLAYATEPAQFPPKLPFNLELSPRAKDTLDNLPADEPRLKQDGKNLWQLFNELFDRRKLLCWRLRVDETNEQIVYVDVFVYQSEAITLSSGLVRPGNADQIALEYDRMLDIAASEIGDDAANRFDEVVCRGARTISVASWSYTDQTIEAGWTGALSSEYDAGPAGIGGLDPAEQERRIREFRAVDQYERVYSWFQVPKSFAGDQEVGDGIGGDKFPLLPANDTPFGVNQGFIPSKHKVDLYEMRFLPRLPFVGGVETYDAVGSRLAAWFRMPENEAEVRTWVHAEHVADTAAVEFTGNDFGRKWACGCAPLEDRPGVRLRAHGGPPHLIAATDFVPITSGASEDAAEIDWRADLIVTAAVELDQFCSGRASFPDFGPGVDVKRRLVIDLGEKYQQVYVVEGTVLRAKDGELERSTGGYLRDDRPELADLAGIAFHWHGTARRPLKLLYKQLLRPVRLGQIVSEIGGGEVAATAVNTLVSGVIWHVADGTTEIKTDFAELDLRAF